MSHVGESAAAEFHHIMGDDRVAEERERQRKRDRRKKIIIALWCIFFLILLLLSIGFFVYLVGFADDVPPGGFISDLNDKDLKGNASESHMKCKEKYGPNSGLAEFASQEEENRFLSDFRAQPADYLKKCPTLLLGYRVSFWSRDADLIIRNGTVPTAVFLRQDKPRQDFYGHPGIKCGMIRTSDNFKVLENPCTVQHQCVLCEYQARWYDNYVGKNKNCPRAHHNPCYVVFSKRSGYFPYNTSSCTGTYGMLALASYAATDEMKKIILENKNCDNRDVGVYVYTPKKKPFLENINGIRAKYTSKNLEPGYSFENCVFATLHKTYPLKYGQCHEKSCYACKIKDRFNK